MLNFGKYLVETVTVFSLNSLNNSDMTEEDCRVLTTALNSNPSNLTELNLSGTKLRNSGMKIFSTLFKNEQCRLKRLK